MSWLRLWSFVRYVVAAIAARFSPTVSPTVPPNVPPEQAPEAPASPQDASEAPAPSQVPVQPSEAPPAPKYDWSTQLSAKHSVRVICDEEGLDVATKNDLTACVHEESAFLPHAIGKPNKDGTQDFGLCQYNNGKNEKGQPYWIGPGAAFSSVEEVLDNPEKNARVMARCFKAGQKGDWSSYKTGAYKKWLPTAADPTVL